MSQARKAFYRADQVGSLLRPKRLLEARSAAEAGQIDAETLSEIEDECIADVVRYQENLGLKAVTDGEFRRENWWIDYIQSIRGVEIHDGSESAVFLNEDDNDWHYVPKDVKTVRKLEPPAPTLVKEAAHLVASATTTVKMTLPSPTRMHFHGGRLNVDEAAYPDMDEFFSDVACIYQQEITALEQAGCHYIQIDDPLLTYFCSPRLTGLLAAQGDEPEALLDRYVALVNDCISHRAPETQLSVHLCRGNSRSSWISEGGYDAIATQVYPHLKVDAFFLEYDDERSGSFEPLAMMPDGQRVVLGLVTTKKGSLETKDDLKRRVDAAARYVPLDNLAISPQCGFASVVEGNLITEDDQSRKLSLVVETAQELWGDLG